MERSRLEWLTRRLLDGLADSGEQAELFGWLREEKDDTVMKEVLEQQWPHFQPKANLPDEQNQQLLQSILDAAKLLQEDEPAVVRPFYNWKRWTAAAAIFLVLLTGGYFLLFNKTENPTETAKTEEPAKDVKAPETNRAMITLADGRTVALDSVTSGLLAQQGNIKLVKLSDGQIAYQTASGEVLKEIRYNTLHNPRGSKVIDMTLADGSRVWLNAGSSVTYPIAFVGKERKVNITGEAYFEVTPNSTMPFKVSKGEMEVTVLGTHFNVNAYDDEADIKVTLLEGSVQVTLNHSPAGQNKPSSSTFSPDRSTVRVKPGQQAVVSANKLSLNTTVNVEEVMAWKNGLFQFEGANIESIMRQISRWYDVEVVYEVNVKGLHFSGDISREVEASKVFKMLEATEAVHFRIEGKKVFVVK